MPSPYQDSRQPRLLSGQKWVVNARQKAQRLQFRRSSTNDQHMKKSSAIYVTQSQTAIVALMSFGATWTTNIIKLARYGSAKMYLPTRSSFPSANSAETEKCMAHIIMLLVIYDEYTTIPEERAKRLTSPGQGEAVTVVETILQWIT